MDEEQRLTLPWIIVDHGDTSELLVSCPDGKLLEVPLTAKAVQLFPDVIVQKSFWEAVFTSLAASLNAAE